MDCAAASCGVYSDRFRLVLSISALSPPSRPGQLSEAPLGETVLGITEDFEFLYNRRSEQLRQRQQPVLLRPLGGAANFALRAATIAGLAPGSRVDY